MAAVQSICENLLPTTAFTISTHSAGEQEAPSEMSLLETNLPFEANMWLMGRECAGSEK
jgi:hypothetical protein